MRKIIALLGVFLGLVAIPVFGVELWNGFTSDMSKEDVVDRVQEVLDVRRIIREKEETSYMILDSFTGGIYKHPDTEVIVIDSSSSLYGQDDNPDDDFGNIVFYFYNKKLFAVEVCWAENQEESYIELINLIKDLYGEPDDSFDRYFSFIWILPGKDLIINAPSRIFCYVDSLTRMSWLAETETEEINRRKSKSRIIF
jgi:hypothetical protein